MTTLIAAGDSFTWGNDLLDCTTITASKHTWAALLAQHLNYNYECVAIPGASNQSIARTVVQAVNQTADVYVAVMWTYPHRLEYKLRKQLDNSNYCVISHWHSLTPEEKLQAWATVDDDKRVFVNRQHLEFEKVGVTTLSKNITEYFNDDQYYIETLRSQIFLMNYLQSKNVPYFFIPACSNLYISSEDIYVTELQKISQQANWLTDISFVDWARSNSYAVGATQHPMELAHLDYFEKFIKPKVNV